MLLSPQIPAGIHIWSSLCLQTPVSCHQQAQYWLQSRHYIQSVNDFKVICVMKIAYDISRNIATLWGLKSPAFFDSSKINYGTLTVLRSYLVLMDRTTAWSNQEDTYKVLFKHYATHINDVTSFLDIARHIPYPLMNMLIHGDTLSSSIIPQWNSPDRIFVSFNNSAFNF